MDVYDVAVVGAGAFGSSTAYQLSKQAPHLSLVLIGPDEPEQDEKLSRDIFGCHYDEGRVTRVIGEDPVEQILASRSLDQYGELEKESGLKIYTESGYLTYGQVIEGDTYLETTNQVTDTFCTEHGIPYKKYNNKSEVMSEWKGLHIEYDKCEGRYTPVKGGCLSIRNLVAACSKIAEKRGATILRTVVTAITKEDCGYRLCMSDEGELGARHVVITCGSFTHHHPALLPRAPQLTYLSHTVLRFEISGGEVLDRYRSLPPFADIYDKKLLVYVLPPILYPDGKWYMKIGHSVYDNDPLCRVLETPSDTSSWYRQPDNPEARIFLRDRFYRIFPDIAATQPPEVIDFCVFSVTATGKPYIGFCDESMFMAIGGNGKGAKAALEIGNICAKAAITGEWDYDIKPSSFRIVYEG